MTAAVPETRPRAWLPLAAALVSVCLWSAAFVGIRAAGRTFSPGALALGRQLLGATLLGAIQLTRPTVRPTRRELGLLLLAGLLWFGLYNIVLNEGERRVDAGTAAMVINVAPIVVVALAAAFLREPFTRALAVGGAVAFGGVIVIGLGTSTGNAPLSGVLLCVLAAASSAVGVVAQKPVLRRVPALQVTWICCAIGALVCLPFAPALLRELRAAPATGIGWILFLGAFPTAVAFTTWAYALARGSAGRVVAMAYLVPPITIVMSWLILNESPPALAVLGGAICLAGVYLARRTPAPVRSKRS